MTTSILKTEDSRPATFGWLQVDKKVGQELQKLAVIHPAAIGTLIYLMSNMGRINALAVFQAVIASIVGVTISVVNRAIMVLNDRRFIVVVMVANLCVYRVNTRVAWQGNRGERFAHFMADIIAFDGEQGGAWLDNLELLNQAAVLVAGECYLVGY